MVYGIYIGASEEKVLAQRSIYSGLEFLGDVGGLYGILYLFISYLVSFFSQGSLLNYLLTQLLLEKHSGPRKSSPVGIDEPLS